MTLFPCGVPDTRKFLKDWVPILLWMGIIFLASSDQHSFLHTVQIIEPIVRWLCPGLSGRSVHIIVVLSRKAAHVTEYGVLALLVWRAFSATDTNGQRLWSWGAAKRTLLLILLFACSDEFHQHFVPSRDASVRDVAIDTAGAVLALLFLWILGRWCKRW